VRRGSLGSPRFVGPHLFPCAGANLTTTVHLGKLLRIIPSCSSSSSESLRSTLPPSPFRAWACLPGFRPSPRHHRGASTCSRVPKSSIRSVRRCSQPLDGFLRAPAPGLVSSQNRLQGVLSSRGFPSPRSERSSSECSAPLPLFHRPLARTDPDGHDRRPRLRGLNPRGARAPRGW
jgi:hypothetical protein